MNPRIRPFAAPGLILLIAAAAAAPICVAVDGGESERMVANGLLEVVGRASPAPGASDRDRLRNAIATGQALALLGKADEARERLDRILDDDLKTSAAEIALARWWSGLWSAQLGDMSGAVSRLESIVDKIEAGFGPRHEHVAALLAQLATLARSTGDDAKGTRWADRALQLVGPGTPCLRSTAILANLNGAWFAFRSGDAGRANDRIDTAHELIEQNLDPADPLLAVFLPLEADILVTQGALDKAAERLKGARDKLQRYARVSGPYVHLAAKLAAIEQLRKRDGDALALAREALDGQRRQKLPEGAYLIDPHVVLALHHDAAGRRTQAREDAVAALRLARSFLGAGHARLRELESSRVGQLAR